MAENVPEGKTEISGPIATKVFLLGLVTAVGACLMKAALQSLFELYNDKQYEPRRHYPGSPF